MDSEDNIRTFIIKGLCFKNDDQEMNNKILTLCHPKLKIGVKLLLANHNLYELLTYKFTSSYFIDDTIRSEGNFILASQIDPVFIVLPYLKAKSKNYVSLDEILADKNYPDICQIRICTGLKWLHLVCDEIENKYMFNEEKLLKWLNKKYDYLVKSMKNKYSDDKITQEANGIFSQYLDEGTFKFFLRTQNNAQKRKSSPVQDSKLFKKQKTQ